MKILRKLLIPEPACLVLLGVGMVGINLIQYKKEKLCG